ncbi:MAG: phosphotransacetylase family protein [Deltaproteobacteria bacterium]|nr:phosphotransacetylase family protein [Deltaproteobacteria bacterium]
MKKIVISSMRDGAGKTSIIAGIISLIKDKKFAYIKPLGDRLIYRRKKSWDYDASLIVKLLGREGELESRFEKITLGFDQSKIRYMYDEEGIKKALFDMVKEIGTGNDILFSEGGRDLFFGAWENLDSISVAKYLDAKLVMVLSGNRDAILDDIKFIDKYLDVKGENFGGIIINKVNELDEFEEIFVPEIKKMGIEILGLIPYKEQLTYFTVDFLAEKLLAKVLAGEENIKNTIKNFIVGAMSTSDPHKNPLFTLPSLNREDQLVITGGDRSDMILAALERDTACIIITNDIMPPQHVISKVMERKVPLLLVSMDTFQTVKKVDDMEALLTKDNDVKLNLLSHLIEKHTRITEFLN